MLVLSLALIFCCFLLLLSLGIWSQQASILASRSRVDLMRQRLSQGLRVELETELAQTPDAVPSVSTYSPPGSNLGAALHWGTDSTYKPYDPTSTSGLFGDWKKNPLSLGYQDPVAGQPVATPPWHALALSSMPGQHKYQTVVSTAFPYGAFAPWGKITVGGQVSSFGNPGFKSTLPQQSTLPVVLAAGKDLEVDGSFILGQAISATGKVTLPQGNGAIPYQGMLFSDPFTQKLHDQIRGGGGVFETIRQDLVDKTDFVAGDVLSPIEFFKLFTGKTNLTAIFGLRQACSIPMPVFPSFINGEDFDVILFHNPYPSDFKGVAASIDIIKHIAEDLFKIVKDAEQAVVDAWKAVAATASAVWDDIKGAFSWITGHKDQAKKDFDEANEKYEEAKQHLSDVLGDLEAAFDSFKQVLDDVADAIKPTPPVTALEERNVDTVGWAYFGILSRIGTDLGDFFTAVFHSSSDNWNQLLSDLMNNTRVVNFVDRNPLGGFTEQGGFTLAMTWTVPQGRTLHLGNSSKPDYTMLGDLWIQRGATLSVEGSLFVIGPTEQEWTYSPALGNTSDIRPSGTIYLEEGATLLVDGNLYASGDPDHGSVMLTSPGGATPPLSTAILCTGDVQLPYGTGSGVALDQLLTYVAKEGGNSALQGVVDDLINPLLVDVAPHMAKAFGPFHSRTCWFSDYAVSLVLIPELVEFGLQGPWPIPLPYTNCWRNIFPPLSKIYSIELNFTLGENLYLHSDWWPFGQGIVPIVPKIDPKSYEDIVSSAFGSLESGELNFGSILETIGEHMEEVIPDFADEVFENVVQGIIKGLIQDLAGDIDDPCGSPPEEGEEQKAQSKVEDALEDVAKDMLKVFGKDMLKMAGTILSEYRDALSEDTKDQISAASGAARELPGVFLYCGGELSLGSSGPAKASGFFFAEGDINCGAQSVFGSVVSRSGDINLDGNLYYYPFYSRGSLWNPQKPGTYIVNGSGPSYLREAIEVVKDGLYLKTPVDGSTVAIGVPGVRTLAEGPR